MKNYIYLFLAIFGLPIFSQAQSQEERCKTEQIRAYYLQKDPSTLERRQAIENFTQDWIRNNQDRRNSQDIITIPVVVHVVYVNATQNISEAQIQSQITVLNEDFRKQNGNFSSTPAEFQSLAADTEIEFCLASRDPEGNSTNGITRTATTVNDIGDSGNDIHYTAQGGKDAWDATRYLNIWVCAIDGGGTLGYATVPGQAPATEDGVVNDYRYFGTMGTVEAPFNLGRTATHEVGHYLNLEHIWGIDGGCEDDDLVSDTPDQDFDSFGCPSHPQNSCGSNDMFVNYMDYSDDACMTMFTEGQKARMLAAINGPRAGLLSSTGCGAPLSVELHHFKATCKSEFVLLSWETTRELEHQQFNIQKSKDGKDFITIGSLKNNQSHQTNKQYEWKDNSPFTKSYYRLQQINQDGTFTFFDVVNTSCNLAADIKLFPNPTQEEFTISLTSFEPLQTLQIQIFDIHGKMIYQMEQVAASEIEVVLPNPIHEGLYFIHLLDDGQSIYQSRLVKQ